MLSSSPNSLQHLLRNCCIVITALATVCCTGAFAAETYFQPELGVRAEYNTNRNMATDKALEASIPGYRGILQGTWGYMTETGSTVFRPRIEFLEYQDRPELERTEEFVDFLSTKRTEKSDFRLFGRYSKRDAFNSELADAVFNDLDPDDPSIAESGEVVIGGTTRTTYYARPEYSYKVTQRTAIGARISVQASRFEDELVDRHVDFDFGLAGMTLSRSLDARTDLSFAPYVSRFETRDKLSRNDSVGVDLGWDREWSEQFSVRVSLTVERSEIEARDAVTGVVTQTETSTDYGPMVAFLREGEAGKLRFSIGRHFTPTDSGGKSAIDQLRLQYERDLRDRLSLTAALRGFRSRSQGSFAGSSDYDYARATIALRWAITRTWFLRSGYEITWRDREFEQGSAANNAVYIEFGYRGLGPRS